MLTEKPIAKKAPNYSSLTEPKSAHSTPTVEHYVEKRKEKADKQAINERQRVHFAVDEWKRLEYVIF